MLFPLTYTHEQPKNNEWVAVAIRFDGLLYPTG
jgi:hypothetical protein